MDYSVMNQIFRQKSYHNRLSSLIFVRFSQIFVLKLKSVIVLKGNGDGELLLT